MKHSGIFALMLLIGCGEPENEMEKTLRAPIWSAGDDVQYSPVSDLSEIKEAASNEPKDEIPAEFTTKVSDSDVIKSDSQIPDAEQVAMDALKTSRGVFIGSEWLVFENMDTTDSELIYLKGLPHLQRLELSNTDITDAALEYLTGLIKLERLVLDGTQITDAGLEKLTGLTALWDLDLSRTNISDAGLIHVSGLTNLVSLRLSYTPITDAGLKHLNGLNSLRSLYLENTQVTLAGAKELKAAIPECSILQ